MLSGIKPTAEMHIGNYFGAVRNWVKLQDDMDGAYGVVDLHAMTVPYDRETLWPRTREIFLSLMAAGIDPDRSLMFVQSLIPEHTELSWILATLTSVGDLNRMTQFKEQSRIGADAVGETDVSDGEFVSSGLLFYPVLQAADILAYKAHFVPVGDDQRQHLELTRGVARRFNHRFGQLFPVPDPLYTKTARLKSLADPSRKMSKSLGPNHYVGLFEESDSVRAKVRAAVTDSGDVPEGEMSPGVNNLLNILEACGAENSVAMREEYRTGTLRYSHLKNEVAQNVVELTTSMRERRRQIQENTRDLDELIVSLSAVARTYAARVLEEVREVTGIVPPRP